MALQEDIYNELREEGGYTNSGLERVAFQLNRELKMRAQISIAPRRILNVLG